MSKVGLVVGCYHFTDNHDNATVTRMVCFHNALTTPEGTRVTQQQLEEFGTRWIPGTISDKDRRADGQSGLAPAVEQLATPRQALKLKARFGPAVIIGQNNAVDKGSGANWATGAEAVEDSRSATPASDDEISPLGELDTPPLTETSGLAFHVDTQSNTQSNRKTSSWLPTNPYPGPVKKGTPQPERLTIVKKHQVTGLTKAVKCPHTDNVDWNHQD